MGYKLLDKFEPYMFWSQGWISLEWTPSNGIQGSKEVLIWSLARFIQHKLGWSENDEWSEITPVSYYLDDILYSVVRSTSPYTEVWIKLATSSKSRIKVMLEQENNQSCMMDGWLPTSGWHVFSKARDWIVGRVIISELPSIQGPQYSEEDLVVWKRNPRSLRGHQSVSIAPTGTMCLLFKCGTIVLKTHGR